MYGPGRFLANTDVQFGTTKNKQTIHMVCLPTTTTIVDYNPMPPHHHPLPTATTNTNENDNDDNVAMPSHEPKQHTATFDDNAPNTSTMSPSPTAERRWSVQVTMWQRAMYAGESLLPPPPSSFHTKWRGLIIMGDMATIPPARTHGHNDNQHHHEHEHDSCHNHNHQHKYDH